MENFDSFELPESILQSLKSMGFVTPTPIQAQTIPQALNGHDILGTAQTGTGKTGAYGIPLISFLLNSTNETALVLTPTRELAQQVLVMLKQILGKGTSIRSALLIGGEPIMRQLQDLKSKPRLIVGTPGRINDHLIRGSLKLNKTKFLVLDETDRMLDMGFSIQIDEIVEHLPEERQTLMFSATMSPEVTKMTNSYLVDAIKVSIGETNTIVEKIEQKVVKTQESEKYDYLIEQLESSDGTFIVFVKTKYSTEKLADKLRDKGFDADAIHGDLRQRHREKVIRNFRNMKSRILVATDVAARGLDIPHIECVINYDLPQCPEDYIHRIGRTGRAGTEGKAISLISPQDAVKWRNICRLIDPEQKTHKEERVGGRGEGRSQGRGRNGGGRERSRNDRFGGRSGERRNRFNERAAKFTKSLEEDRNFSGEEVLSKEERKRARAEERSGGFRRREDGAPRNDRPRSERTSGGFGRRRDADAPRSDRSRGEKSENSFRRREDDTVRSDRPRSERSSGFGRRREDGAPNENRRVRDDTRAGENGLKRRDSNALKGDRRVRDDTAPRKKVRAGAQTRKIKDAFIAKRKQRTA